MAVTQPLVSNLADLRNAVPVTPFPVYVNHRQISTVENETVPAGALKVIITVDADCWFANGAGAAVVPSSDVVNGTGSFLLKAGVARAFSVTPGQVLSGVAATGTANVSFEYFL